MSVSSLLCGKFPGLSLVLLPLLLQIAPTSRIPDASVSVFKLDHEHPEARPVSFPSFYPLVGLSLYRANTGHGTDSHGPDTRAESSGPQRSSWYQDSHQRWGPKVGITQGKSGPDARCSPLRVWPGYASLLLQETIEMFVCTSTPSTDLSTSEKQAWASCWGQGRSGAQDPGKATAPRRLQGCRDRAAKPVLGAQRRDPKLCLKETGKLPRGEDPKHTEKSTMSVQGRARRAQTEEGPPRGARARV